MDKFIQLFSDIVKLWQKYGGSYISGMANTLILLYHDFLLGRRCSACGQLFTDSAQQNACPFCGAPDPEWTLS